MTLAKRLKGMGSPKYQRDGDPRTSGPGFGVSVHEDALTLPLTWRKPRRIFVNSMSDLFHEDVPDEFIARAWQVMGAAPWHTYQLLTKRHARMRSWVKRWYDGEIEEPYDERPVPGFPGYRVTTTGVVLGKRADTAAGMQQEAGEQGHRRVRLHREGSPRNGESVLVHRVVLHAFSRAPQPGEQAMHLNGDAGDNRLSNLRWGTQEENWRDRDRHGNRQSYRKVSADDVVAIRARAGAGESGYSIAKDYPITDAQVRNITSGKHWPERAPLVYGTGQRAVLDCVWLGVSVEDQKWADIRIPALLETPAAVRWLSCEPLLGPVDLLPYLHHQCDCDPPGHRRASEYGPRPDWVVVGGESGPGARPMHPGWARALLDQCTNAGVPFFFKQAGAVLAREWGCSDRKGHNPSEWPEPFPRGYPNA